MYLPLWTFPVVANDVREDAALSWAQEGPPAAPVPRSGGGGGGPHCRAPRWALPSKAGGGGGLGLLGEAPSLLS